VARLVEQSRFRRGFIEEVQLSGEAFAAHAEELSARAPIRSVHLNPRLEKEIEETVWHALELADDPIGDAGAQALAQSPHLGKLTTLDLAGNLIGPEGAAALAASPHLAGLTALHLGYDFIGPEGAAALAASPHLAGLTELTVEGNENHLGDEGRAMLRERFPFAVF
jgi:hypothetical protein